MTKTCVMCRKQPVSGDITRSFHKFPTNSELKQKWMNVIGIQNIKKVSTVCSDHFEDEAYHQTDGYTKTRRLLSTAVPVLHRSNSVLEQITGNNLTSTSIEDSTGHRTCPVYLEDYSSGNSFDSSRNTNSESDSSMKREPSSYIDDSDVSHYFDLGIVYNSDLSFHQSKGSEQTRTKTAISAKRKQSIFGKSIQCKKKFCFMDGCQPSHVSREDFISDEAWVRFLKLMVYKNCQLTNVEKMCWKRAKQISNLKKIVKSIH